MTGPTPAEATQSPAHSTRSRLLDVAEQLFAEQGFGETSVRDITQAAGANLAAVNYHFGSKDNLYVEVFRRRLVELRDHRINSIRAAMNRPNATLEDVVRAFALSFIEPLKNHERGRMMCNLYSREMMHPLLPKGMIFVEMIFPIKQTMTAALDQVCPGLDEKIKIFVMHSLVGQLLHFLQSSEMYQQNGIDDNPLADMQLWVEHVVRFTTAGIQSMCPPDGGRNGKSKRGRRKT
jgi:AcrR family transcriptional regulator